MGECPHFGKMFKQGFYIILNKKRKSAVRFIYNNLLRFKRTIYFINFNSGLLKFLRLAYLQILLRSEDMIIF